MAPESLRSLEFSTASDVWSFGLTCWEILTHGGIPFAELQSSQDLLKFASNGNHLPQPACATTEMYAIFFYLYFSVKFLGINGGTAAG